jgi:hypothetical protein
MAVRLISFTPLGTCHKLAGGEGGGNRGRVIKKWAVKKGRVTQMYANVMI